MKKYFYDIHIHTFNLSHPHLLSFIGRKDISVPMLLTMFFPFVTIGVVQNSKKKIYNLLSVMERDMGNYFLTIESEIRALLNNNSKIEIGSTKYDKMIITPLMMDFGYKELENIKDIHFKKPPRKPIREQVHDLFNGIKIYFENKFEDDDDDPDYKELARKKRILEIFPFLGLNTFNYTYDKLYIMLNKYFKEYK